MTAVEAVEAVEAVTDVDEFVVPEKDRRSLSQLIESNTYMTQIDLTEFFDSWLSYNSKCVFKQNNLINTLI